MRALHTRLFALRTQARRLRARAALRRPGWVRPAELVLRLDPLGLPGWPSDTKDLSLARLQDRVAEAVRWRGALPVTVVTERLATDERVSEVARFAHRLECPTEIRARATHLSSEQALRIIDTGVDSVVLVLDGDLPGRSIQHVLWPHC